MFMKIFFLLAPQVNHTHDCKNVISDSKFSIGVTLIPAYGL